MAQKKGRFLPSEAHQLRTLRFRESLPMNIDSPRETGSMSADIDGSAVSRRHPSGHGSDLVKMDSSGSHWGRALADFHSAGSIQSAVQSLPGVPSSDCERLFGADDSPRLMVLAPTPPYVTQLRTEPGDVHERRGLAEQHRDMLSSLHPSLENVAPRKRKHTYSSMTDDNDIPYDNTFIDGTDSRRRRVRPRPQGKQVTEFSPLLIVPRGQDPPAEETISAFHFPQTVIDASHSIRRYFHAENSFEHGPRVPQSSSLPGVDNLVDPKESGRSDSASSFTEVALASTVTPKHGRLSTLQDFWLPRPFEETERPFMDGVKVHERGLEVPPPFFSTGSGRMDGLEASPAELAGSTTDALRHSIRKHDDHAISPRSAILPLEPASTTIYFDGPLCDSPDSIGSDEDKFARPGLSGMQVDHDARSDPTPQGQPDRR